MAAFKKLFLALVLAMALFSAAQPVSAQPYSYALLSNAAAAGPTVLPSGGNYQLFISGTFGGATLTLSETIAGQTFTLGTYTSAPATPPCLSVASGTVLQMTVAGGSPSGLFSSIGGVAVCPFTSTFGGYEFNASVIPTVQNAAYAAGQSLGGLQTISVGSTNGLSGILSQIQVASKGGSTVAVVAYVWQKNPAATTCTDKANFVVSQTDNQQLIAPPQSLSLATAVSAQDASTYGAASGLAANFANGSANTNIYVCLLASAAVTPATTTDYRINIQGIKDEP